jgi:hypothetical protein
VCKTQKKSEIAKRFRIERSSTRFQLPRKVRNIGKRIRRTTTPRWPPFIAEMAIGESA